MALSTLMLASDGGSPAWAVRSKATIFNPLLSSGSTCSSEGSEEQSTTPLTPSANSSSPYLSSRAGSRSLLQSSTWYPSASAMASSSRASDPQNGFATEGTIRPITLIRPVRSMRAARLGR